LGKADALATRLGEEFVSMRGKTMPQFLSVVDGASIRWRGRSW
jgi:hypothetical protein